MPELIYFAIRERDTGCYLLEQHYSYTHSRPRNAETAQESPRLFKTEKAANQALAAWLKGRWYVDAYGEFDIDTDSTRKPENMEVVAVTLTIP